MAAETKRKWVDDSPSATSIAADRRWVAREVLREVLKRTIFRNPVDKKRTGVAPAATLKQAGGSSPIRIEKTAVQSQPEF